ncbi:MAG TPA: restriction endonuclease subunit S [Cyclobacteriaceae bacterium]|nr:restriction endonuclease subunit S [Cyclobacteriaceae bacterium]
MNVEKLSAVIETLESGARPKGGAVLPERNAIPSLGAEHLNDSGGFKFEKIKFIPRSFFKEMSHGIIKKGDILVVKDGATTGKVSLVDSSFPFEKAAINEHVFLLRVSDRAFNEYVFHFLKSPVGQIEIQKDFRGATVGGISRNFIEIIKLPVPSINQQVQIASILRKADGLIKQRKESINLLNVFLDSKFFEMFGDPVRNEKKWPKAELSSILSNIKSGWSPVCEDFPRADEKELAVLKLSAVTYGEFDPTQNKKLKQGTQIKKRVEPNSGDVLFSRKNTLDLVGATAYVFKNYPNLLLSDTIFKLEYNNRTVNGLFLWKLLSNLSLRRQLKALATGSAGSMPNISQERLLHFSTILPPLEMQVRFADIVHKVKNLNTIYQSGLIELENLYGSLSQKAFKGTLKLK